MTKRDRKGPTWTDVKAVLVQRNASQLVALASDLYKLSNENRLFFHTRFILGEDPLGPYKSMIEECMYPDVFRNKPVEVSRAKSVITRYSKAAGDRRGEVELMTFFVECGNNFTVDYGDIGERFYDALNRMYRRALTKVLDLPKEEMTEFKARLKAIMISGSGIGWGYSDTLSDDYFDAFPEED